jgi:16S rRNA (guanine(966)-N(2))-methyltransferase RsmD
VVSGSKKGGKIKIPKSSHIRPTIDRVKEAIFSALQFKIQEKSFLDLFSGSGQMGIEALSRGASSAVFIDNSFESIKIIKKNISDFEFEDKSKVFLSDAIEFLETTNFNFDIAFLDPPYGSENLSLILSSLAKKMKPGGIFVCENSRNTVVPENVRNFSLKKRYHYGDILVTMYN